MRCVVQCVYCLNAFSVNHRFIGWKIINNDLCTLSCLADSLLYSSKHSNTNNSSLFASLSLSLPLPLTHSLTHKLSESNFLLHFPFVCYRIFIRIEWLDISMISYGFFITLFMFTIRYILFMVFHRTRFSCCDSIENSEYIHL